MLACICGSAKPQTGPPDACYDDRQVRLLDEFLGVRAHCPVLNDILVPSEIFEHWRVSAVPSANDPARHQSVAFGAFKAGTLRRLTTPLHRFLVEGSNVSEKLTAQYRRDLQERWVLATTPAKRHQQARKFASRLAELEVASWLERRNWTVTNLEATGGRHDIECASPEGSQFSMEVKYIGIQDEDFRSLLLSLTDGSGLSTPDLEAPINYLVFRANEAARQLDEVPHGRRVVLVVDGLAWHNFEWQLANDWIDWNAPELINGGQAWDSFTKGKSSDERDMTPLQELVSKHSPPLILERTEEGLSRRYG